MAPVQLAIVDCRRQLAIAFLIKDSARSRVRAVIFLFHAASNIIFFLLTSSLSQPHRGMYVRSNSIRRELVGVFFCLSFILHFCFCWFFCAILITCIHPPLSPCPNAAMKANLPHGNTSSGKSSFVPLELLCEGVASR
ncbi:unnamed protein product [Ceratitis capitata]|uniref:(Mediterranean fruit fly) hypothetical protein n=1 Tax=Ceratitis capitata TaxID=7213 RepID=A0A811VAK7_CERCA|nr:unnamed protein product [Ceratitis capitata]